MTALVVVLVIGAMCVGSLMWAGRKLKKSAQDDKDQQRLSQRDAAYQLYPENHERVDNKRPLYDKNR